MARAKFSTLLRAGASLAKELNNALPCAAVDMPRPKRLGERNRVLPEGVRDHHAESRRRSQRGEGRLKNITYVVVFLLLIYCAIKIIPAYVSEYQLADKMQEQARFAIVNRYTEEQIRDNVYKMVQDLDIPAKREEIKVVSTNSVVKISLEYTVPVDLLVYHLDLHFTPTSENKALL